MSAGHVDNVEVSSKEVDKYANDKELQKLVGRLKNINHDYDVPYLAGYSTDGTTVYIDRDVPETITAKSGGRTYTFNPVDFLKVHETWEKAVIDKFGLKYLPAHHIATKMEHRKVLEAGIPLSVYDGPSSVIAKYIKIDEHEKIKKVPPDLDLTPYKGDRKILPHLLKHMGKDKGKISKTESGYHEDAGPKEHCGPVKGWERGDCVNFQEPSSCKKVSGFINVKGWCNLWQGKDE